LVPIEAASFFLAAWIFQMLFNSLVVGHFGLLRPVSYLQAADLPQLGRRIKDEIKKFFGER
ncbi:MAG: hypothetical protein H5U03_05900, partial [Clostridia bacterium]|nr:hypothetical protein [Clostridia bacterium]